MLLGQGANLLLQAASFVLLARLLGLVEYGIFAGAFALVNVITPYSSLGANMLFMRHVTADRSQAPVYWGNTLIVTSALTVVVVIVVAFAGPAVTNIHHGETFIMLAIANCLFSQITSTAGVVFQTFEKMGWTAALNSLSNLARFLVVLFMRMALHRATALQWSIGVVVASGCAAFLSMVWVRREIGAPSFDVKMIRRRMWEGVGFSFAGTTQALYNDIDKTMLSHYRLNRENGFYSLAYRIIDISTSPIFAIAAAALPRFFRGGNTERKAVVRLGFKAALLAALIGVVIAGCTLSLAPIVPRIVGRDFSGVMTALHWLCWIPVLRGIHYMTGSAITGLGRQRLRTAAQFVVAGTNILLNLWWIPAFGWIGAAWSSVASDGLLAALNVGLLLWLGTRFSSEEKQAEVGL